MVRVIMGKKGSGKTKQMIELINAAVDSRARQRGLHRAQSCQLTYDIDYNIRLVEASDFDIKALRVPEGHGLTVCMPATTTSPMCSSTPSASVVPCDGGPEVEEFLDWLDAFSEKNNIKFTVTISADAELAHEGVRKYF